MKDAAIGVRMHSGWGALLVVSGQAATLEVIVRRCIVLADPNRPGAVQPYHFAAEMELPEATNHLANSAGVSAHLARVAIQTVVRELLSCDYRIIGAAVLLASGRPLPSLSKILASHPLIHTAEGEFFRSMVWRACEHLAIPVTGIRERHLDQCAQARFGNRSAQVQQRIAGLKSSLGPPWTEDQKKASLAASLVLAAFRSSTAFIQEPLPPP
ncbi:MAG TPA: hypothetical protein VHZ55_20075 [Bryobacteraceae bacterium]|nr:hypothetical protein [Bryobacteraceae bacterium]